MGVGGCTGFGGGTGLMGVGGAGLEWLVGVWDNWG